MVSRQPGKAVDKNLGFAPELLEPTGLQWWLIAFIGPNRTTVGLSYQSGLFVICRKGGSKFSHRAVSLGGALRQTSYPQLQTSISPRILGTPQNQ